MTIAAAPTDDFWSTFMSNSLPALMTTALVGPDKTASNLSAMLPYYQELAQNAQTQNANAAAAAAALQGRVNAMPTAGDAAQTAGTDFDLQQGNKVQQLQQDLAAKGVRPDSGAYTGAMAALNGANASAGKVNAMNTAGQGEGTAITNAQSAITPLLTAQPGNATLTGALSGETNLYGLQAAAHSQQVKNITAAFSPSTLVSSKPAVTTSPSITNFYGTPAASSGGTSDFNTSDPD